MQKGLTYYKLQKLYAQDITKNCGLTAGEVDENFHFLRGMDIETFTLTDNTLILTRFNGETVEVNLPYTFSPTIADDLVNINTEIDTLEQEVEGLKNDSTEIRDKVAEVDEKIDCLTTQTNEIFNTISEYIDDLYNKHNEVVVTINAIDGRLQIVETDLNTTKNKVVEIENSLLDTIRILNGLTDWKDTVVEPFMDDVTDSLARLQEKDEAIELRLDNAEDRLTTAESNIDEVSGKTEELHTWKTDVVEPDILSMKDNITALHNKDVELGDDINALETRMDTVEAFNAEADTRISDIEGWRDNTVDPFIENTQEAITELRAKDDTLSASIEALEGRMDIVEDFNVSIDARVTNLEDWQTTSVDPFITTTTSDISNLQAKDEEIAENIGTLEGRVTVNENFNADAETRISDIEDWRDNTVDPFITSTNENFSLVNQHLTNINQRINGNHSNITTLSSLYGAINDKVSTNSNKIEQLTEKNTLLSTKIGENKNSITEINGIIAQLQSIIADVSGDTLGDIALEGSLLVFSFKDGHKTSIDLSTLVGRNIFENIYFDADANKLIFVTFNGTQIEVPLGSLVTLYEGDGKTIRKSDGNVFTAIVDTASGLTSYDTFLTKIAELEAAIQTPVLPNLENDIRITGTELSKNLTWEDGKIIPAGTSFESILRWLLEKELEIHVISPSLKLNTTLRLPENTPLSYFADGFKFTFNPGEYLNSTTTTDIIPESYECYLMNDTTRIDLVSTFNNNLIVSTVPTEHENTILGPSSRLVCNVTYSDGAIPESNLGNQKTDKQITGGTLQGTYEFTISPLYYYSIDNGEEASFSVSPYLLSIPEGTRKIALRIPENTLLTEVVDINSPIAVNLVGNFSNMGLENNYTTYEYSVFLPLQSTQYKITIIQNS